MDAIVYIYVFCWLYFSEMASQKWIVLFAILVLFTFIVEARSSTACRLKAIQEFKETLTAVKNCSCTGKSPNCPVKVKRRRDEQRFHKVCIERVSLFQILVVLTQAGTFIPAVTSEPEQNHLPVSNLAQHF